VLQIIQLVLVPELPLQTKALAHQTPTEQERQTLKVQEPVHQINHQVPVQVVQILMSFAEQVDQTPRVPPRAVQKPMGQELQMPTEPPLVVQTLWVPLLVDRMY